MKSAFTILIMIFLIVMNTMSLYSKVSKTSENILAESDIPPVNYLLDHSSMGTEFWVAFPPNGPNYSGLTLYGLDIVVTSVKNTTVRVEIEDQFLKTKQVEAFKPTIFSSSRNDFGVSLEVIESDEISYKAIHITSDEPVSVFVLNNRRWSSEGYCAIPVSSWGENYIHNSYWDFRDGNTENGGGFIIMASETGTRVNIDLKGKGEGIAKTLGGSGRDIGDSYQITLNRGQTYMLCGDGTTKGQFDISGTTISANKPIGLISFHMRTMIPTNCPNDRDNIMEMLTPTNTWGKFYVTVQFDRAPQGQYKGEGDFFRVVSKEANTNVGCKYYDIKSGELEGNWTGVLKEKGSFAEYFQTSIYNSGNSAKSVRGISVWESEKPFMLMQYAYSYPWDNNRNWSPLAILIPPVDNFVRSAVFQTPFDDFSENILTFFAIGDPDDPKHEKLKSIFFDGEPIVNKYPQLLGSQIPGTDIYWIRINLNETGVHTLHSDKTKLWGYLNGFSYANAYGWPIAMGASIIDKEDSSPPQFVIKGNCGNYEIEATEKNNSGNTDAGLSKIFMYDSSYNYNFEIIDHESFKPEKGISSRKFTLNLQDPLQPAKAWFVAMDRAGNLNSDSVDYEPEDLLFNIKENNFGNTRVGTKKDSSFIIINQGIKQISIENVTLKYGAVFSLDEPELPKTLNGGDTLKVEYSYMPDSEPSGEAQFDMDTVLVSSECIDYAVILKGKGTKPHIVLHDLDFGTVIEGTQVCYEDLFETGLVIKNSGTAELTVQEIKGVKSPFLISSPDPEFPFTIQPGDDISFFSICFLPPDSGYYEQDIIVVSDAEDDSTVTLRGNGIPDPSSVNEIIIDDKFISVVPNPVFGEDAEILFHNSLNVNTIDLYDVNGSQVKKIFSSLKGVSSSSHVFSTNNLTSGVYYLKINSDKRVYIKRIVIIK